VSDPGVENSEHRGPGPLLRRAREAQGLSEQEVAEQLNLDATIVTALENDDLAALGAPVFARGHLRHYGELLGIPADELLTSYQQARTQPAQPTLVPHSRLEMTPERDRPVWPWAIGGMLLFLLGAGLVAYVSEYGLTLPFRGSTTVSAGAAAPGDTAEPGAGDRAVDDLPAAVGAGESVPASTPDASTASPDAAATGTSGDAGGVTTGNTMEPGPAATPDAASAETPQVPAGHVSVTMSFAIDSWAEIYDGAGKAVLYDLGRAGTRRTISGAAPLSVTFGNAPGVTIAVNGRPVPLPPRPADQSVARFQIAADGSLH
jgi:cytoskeleton protein RodZ